METKPDPAASIGETIRPSHDALAIAQTAASGSFDSMPRVLPLVSVDLRAPQTALPTVSHSHDLEIRSLLGEGGMGRVLLARQHSLSRDVAVKTARPDASETERQAILVEGFVAGQLEHPAIVPVHALGVDSSGLPVLVMKRIEGVSWDELLKDPRHPGWEGWEGTPEDRLAGHLQILVSVCNALDFAHSRGVVHRDLKPANVLIGRFGDVYLADWGVATRVGTLEGRLCGTPAYLAPEMVSGGKVDARTDVYLLGATLHQVLTGAPRHSAPTMEQTLLAAQRSTPASYGPAVPVELGELANSSCHLEPERRPAGARAFRDELGRYVRHREARALAVRSVLKLDEAQALDAVAAPTSEGRARFDALTSEARFGLTQSLEQFPENPAARDALTRLERLLERRREHTAALEREARERDPNSGALVRTISIGGIALAMAAEAVVSRSIGDQPTTTQVVLFPAFMLVALVLWAVVTRRRYLATLFDRQVFACMLIPLVLMVVGRSAAFFVPMPLASHFVRDAFVYSATWAVASVALLRWTWLISVVFAIDGLLTLVWPASCISLFMSSAAVSLGLAAVASWLDYRRARAATARTP